MEKEHSGGSGRCAHKELVKPVSGYVGPNEVGPFEGEKPIGRSKKELPEETANRNGVTRTAEQDLRTIIKKDG